MKSILEICDPSKKREVPAGEVLLSEGNTSGHLYILVEGRIEVLRGSTQVAVVSEPGSVSVKCRSCSIRLIPPRFAPFRL